jgi:hypothetical protein
MSNRFSLASIGTTEVGMGAPLTFLQLVYPPSYWTSLSYALADHPDRRIQA